MITGARGVGCLIGRRRGSVLGAGGRVGEEGDAGGRV